jgi:hypothetical protein
MQFGKILLEQEAQAPCPFRRVTGLTAAFVRRL